MEIIIITFLFIASLAFIYFNDIRRDKAEKERFREFVIANKTKDISEYAQAIPADEPYNEPELEDELIDLDQMTPEELLTIRQKELK